MQKIVYVNGTTLLGGGPKHLYQLIKQLNPQEWEAVVCTRNDGPYWGKFRSLDIKIYDLALRELSLFTLFRLLHILRRERPALIHTHGKGPGLYGRLIGKILNIPTVHTFHGFHYEALPTLTRWLHLLAENLLSLVTSQHIFVSMGEKKRARVITFLDKENSTVIHNGVDYEYTQKLCVDQNAVLKSIDCEDWRGNKILGTISRLSPEKGVLDLLSGFSQVIQSEPNLKLMIVGGYPEEHKNYYFKAKALIEREQLKEHVRILGYRQDALKILKCMNFYISPSLSEGLPISLLEAFAARVPAIATEIPGNRDVLCNSDFGILSDPGSPESLAQGIRKMLALSDRERDIISQNAFNRVRDNFSVTAMTDETFRLYRQVLNKARTQKLASPSKI
jgi:glycosyltransferase involved in cell wall biosynthesis